MRALAIIYVYNEADVLRWTLGHLLAQGIDLRIVDNWSTDDSFAIAHGFEASCASRVRVSRFPEAGPESIACWHEMLRHTEELAVGLGYDWYLHHDADEIRRSRIPGERLIEALARIDAQGFSAVDHDLHTFAQRGGYDGSISPEAYFLTAADDAGDQRRGQVKAWKQPPGVRVDLASSGGHRVDFPGIRIAPERLILQHYPLRSAAQAARKLRERAQRWSAADRQRGWHCQYAARERARLLAGS